MQIIDVILQMLSCAHNKRLGLIPFSGTVKMEQHVTRQKRKLAFLSTDMLVALSIAFESVSLTAGGSSRDSANFGFKWCFSGSLVKKSVSLHSCSRRLPKLSR